jgi:hypothetical protein
VCSVLDIVLMSAALATGNVRLVDQFVLCVAGHKARGRRPLTNRGQVVLIVRRHHVRRARALRFLLCCHMFAPVFQLLPCVCLVVCWFHPRRIGFFAGLYHYSFSSYFIMTAATASLFTVLVG